MKLELWRDKSNDKNTHGTIYVNGMYECRSLEDVVREIAGVPVEVWKIPKQTAIPSGIYDLEKYFWQKHQKFYLKLRNVLGFTDIYVHGGVSADDSEGCILTGKKYLDDYTILQSQIALQALNARVFPALEAGERVQLEIKNFIYG